MAGDRHKNRKGLKFKRSKITYKPNRHYSEKMFSIYFNDKILTLTHHALLLLPVVSYIPHFSKQ